jgi:hypothetical protein
MGYVELNQYQITYLADFCKRHELKNAKPITEMSTSFSPCDERGASQFDIGLDVAAWQLVCIVLHSIIYSALHCAFLVSPGWERFLLE